MSQEEAAAELGISVVRVGWRIACEYLTPAHNSKKEAGVTRASVAYDRDWLASASWAQKVSRVLKCAFRWL